MNENSAQPEKGGWRQSRELAAVELFIVFVILLTDHKNLLPFGTTPYLLGLGWISLRLRGVGWRGVGLTAPYKDWKTTLALGIAAGVLIEVFDFLVLSPLLVALTGKMPDLGYFRMLNGNIQMTLLYLVYAWTVFSFGEELIYRGYLMNRVADLFNRTRCAWLFSLVAVHTAFGLQHIYQGMAGVIDIGVVGLLLGAIYLRTGRNLAVPIVAHGVLDSITFVLIYLGKYPGM